MNTDSATGPSLGPKVWKDSPGCSEKQLRLRQSFQSAPAAYLLSLTGNVNLVWLAYPIAEIASAAATAFFFARIYRQKIKPLFQ